MPAWTIARAQSAHGWNVAISVAPAVGRPLRAAAKIALRSACSIHSKRSGWAWRTSRSRTPAGKSLARRERRLTVGEDQHRADLARPARAAVRGGDRELEQSIDV